MGKYIGSENVEKTFNGYYYGFYLDKHKINIQQMFNLGYN